MARIDVGVMGGRLLQKTSSRFSDALIHLASPLDRHDLQQSLLIVQHKEDTPAADSGLPRRFIIGW